MRPVAPEFPAVPVQPFMVSVVPAQVTPELLPNVIVCAFDPKSIIELAFRFKVDEFVQVLVAAIPVVLNLTPFNTICDAKVALATGLSLISPPVMVVVPVV